MGQRLFQVINHVQERAQKLRLSLVDVGLNTLILALVAALQIGLKTRGLRPPIDRFPFEHVLWRLNLFFTLSCSLFFFL